MLTYPCAKINIGLNIKAKRADGYHSVETVFYPIGLTDRLEVIPDSDGGYGIASMDISGIMLDGEESSNLVVKAYHLLSDRFILPSVLVKLHKSIPPGGGLGGGSSDGAFMLVMLSRLFNLGLSKEELQLLAGELGSDCPFFIDPVPSLAVGRGEELTPFLLDIKGLNIWLFHPGAGISTVEAYRNVTSVPWSVSLIDALQQPLSMWAGLVRNDFEAYAFTKIPLIQEIRDACYGAGALYSSMTSSGSAVYALFKEQREVPELIRPYLIWEGLLV
ncbi:MAG: 4-(cytidine 5'-diphospho)-2-C-methyl-D-erythritol kinase [Bacteroidales bacterium]|nr:4-(cytidine 5'-diphospho)-2-C-methyl-D-erythritol kinase [Bacteroidales bacterium]